MGLFLNVINLNRRHCIALASALALAGINSGAAQAQTMSSPPAGPTIVVLGDSLSAEYGIKRGSGWVALLEKKLTTEKIAANVVNASISGDTTSGGRARLGALLDKHQPNLVVIELGANDALQGLPLALTQGNLSAMVQSVQATGAKVLLVGIQVPPNYGRDYGERFARMYGQVAKANKVALVPFMLKGVADVPDSLKWFQADRIHPLEAAHPIILANIWPELKKVLR
ncbi:arylesterase [Rhodoferax fermentans]|uniref:Arylesterase n=1 Tax=Rhodoferax fermentans TaxID=28066 RepID=A0A1T1AUK8_RHOFE|nr:arylesterase [Rhodoferax fermentans]OOV07794.1 arylesterase [Rhodoferax fermentans]